MSEHLPDVELTPEQEARAASIWESLTYKGARDGARLIVHQQDRIAELELIARAAQAVCAYDWSDNDDEAVAAMDGLNDAVVPWLARRLVPMTQESQLRTALGELRQSAENPFDKSKAVFAGKSKGDGYLLKCWFETQEDLDAAVDVVERLPLTKPLACPGTWPECHRTDCQTQMRCVHGPAVTTEAPQR